MTIKELKKGSRIATPRKIESFGKIKKDGSLDLRQKGIYGLEHLAIVLLKKIKYNYYYNDKYNFYFVFKKWQ